jgi:hypothetical protein
MLKNMPIVFDIASIHSCNQDSGILCYSNNNYLHSPVLHNDEAVQPLQQNYRFMAFHAPISQFQLPTGHHKDTTEFALPHIYSTVDYMQPMTGEFNWNGTFGLQQAGQVNALRVIPRTFCLFRRRITRLLNGKITT